MTPKRQRRVLAGLLAGLAVIVVWRFVSLGAGGTAGGSDGSRAAAAGTGIAALRVEPLRLADLELEEGEFHVGRDPFRFAARSSPPPRPEPPAERARPVNRTPTPDAGPRAGAGPQPPPVDVVYLGRFGTTSRPIAVFSDGNEIYNVLEGGVIKGQFMVANIGYESADLKFVGFPDAPAKRLAVGG